MGEPGGSTFVKMMERAGRWANPVTVLAQPLSFA